jgi:hypothetical protein
VNRATSWGRGEDDINPVVGISEGQIGEGRVDAVAVHPVATNEGGLWGMQRWTVHSLAGEIAVILGIVSLGHVVGGDVSGVGSDGDWRGEAHLLPARGRLVAEGRSGQKGATT